ncbi:hypothetical protein [Streptomyces gobiensis]|uniref:hypothetical protein n=1 Tax=Streptomyces gobiensis TaxID=2875706 RepID=UPI001E3105E9|nr:hypothetical protein [Streptomyces gobiensis]UGY91647.1 hypothetical protein test1122_07865 [Streptomyces gobiensis]
MTATGRTSYCGARRPAREHGPAIGGHRLPCVLPVGHDGWHHQDAAGRSWFGTEELAEALAVDLAADALRELFSTPDAAEAEHGKTADSAPTSAGRRGVPCVLGRGHHGLHRDVYGLWWVDRDARNAEALAAAAPMPRDVYRSYECRIGTHRQCEEAEERTSAVEGVCYEPCRCPCHGVAAHDVSRSEEGTG